MALTESELFRIKQELGYNMLEVGAEPYINVAPLFSQVIQDNLNAGASTTSITAVVAASTPTQTTLTLADATGFAYPSRAVVDVDSLEETATIQSVAGSTITLLLALAHTGTYPVVVEGGETKVRSILRILEKIETQFGVSAITSAGLKVVDEIEFDTGSGSGSMTPHENLVDQQSYWRDQLASTIGVANRWKLRSGGSQRVEMY